MLLQPTKNLQSFLHITRGSTEFAGADQAKVKIKSQATQIGKAVCVTNLLPVKPYRQTGRDEGSLCASSRLSKS